MTQKILIIKAGTTYPQLSQTQGDFENWTQTALGVPFSDLIIANPDTSKKLPALKRISGVVITGSHDMVTSKTPKQAVLHTWVEQILKKDIPLLGICYGHQLIAKVLGGKVAQNPTGPEYGTRKITRTPAGKTDPLFALLKNSFDAQTAHTQMVTQPPKEAVLLAYNRACPYQALRFRPYVWGVQFHPEFNVRVMDAYIDEAQKTAAKNKAPRIRKTVRFSYDSAEILYRFAQICEQPNTPLLMFGEEDPF